MAQQTQLMFCLDFLLLQGLFSIRLYDWIGMGVSLNPGQSETAVGMIYYCTSRVSSIDCSLTQSQNVLIREPYVRFIPLPALLLYLLLCALGIICQVNYLSKNLSSLWSARGLLKISTQNELIFTCEHEIIWYTDSCKRICEWIKYLESFQKLYQHLSSEIS